MQTTESKSQAGERTQSEVEFIGGVTAHEAIALRPNAFKAIKVEGGSMVFDSPGAAYRFKNRIRAI